MKNAVGLVVAALALTMILAPVAYAKTYKTMVEEISIFTYDKETFEVTGEQKISIGDVIVEIPEDLILPSYVSRLKYFESIDSRAYDGFPLFANFYTDPEFQYTDPEGYDLFPFVELMKEEKGSYHLVALFFIGDDNLVKAYIDRHSMTQPATDKLKKDPYSKPAAVKKVPRK